MSSRTNVRDLVFFQDFSSLQFPGIVTDSRYPPWAFRFLLPRIELKASTAAILPMGPVAKQA